MNTHDSKNKMKIINILTLCILGTSTLFSMNLKNNNLSDSIVSESRDTNFYVYVDENAIFLKGGINEFREYVEKKLIYPVNAGKNKIEGKVIIQFGVNCNGDIGFVKVLRSSGNIDLDNESIRVVNSSPKWIPAKIGKKFVGQNFVLPVVFKL
jgi:TonB family protein